MYLQLVNGSRLWLPVNVLNQGGQPLSWLYWVLRFVEISLYGPALFAALLLCTLSWKIRVFHVNMMCIFIVFSGMWVECLIAQLLFIPYKDGFVKLQDYEKSPTIIDANSTAQTVWEHFPLIVGSFLNLHYAFLASSCTAAAVLERAVATFLIQDYEKHSRVYISTVVLLASNFYAALAATSAMFGCLTKQGIFFMPVFMAAVSYIVYIFLYWYNSRVQWQLETNSRTFSYSLAVRFQAKETLRTIKLLKNVFCVVTVAVCVVCCMSLITVFGYFVESQDEIWSICYCLIFLNPLYVVVTIVLTTPEWRRAVGRKIPRRMRRASVQASTQVKKYGIRVKEDTDLYWAQFNRQW